eukprot:4109501-Amphidinium_carterae.1
MKYVQERATGGDLTASTLLEECVASLEQSKEQLNPPPPLIPAGQAALAEDKDEEMEEDAEPSAKKKKGMSAGTPGGTCRWESGQRVCPPRHPGFGGCSCQRARDPGSPRLHGCRRGLVYGRQKERRWTRDPKFRVRKIRALYRTCAGLKQGSLKDPFYGPPVGMVPRCTNRVGAWLGGTLFRQSSILQPFTARMPWPNMAGSSARKRSESSLESHGLTNRRVSQQAHPLQQEAPSQEEWCPPALYYLSKRVKPIPLGSVSRWAQNPNVEWPSAYRV